MTTARRGSLADLLPHRFGLASRLQPGEILTCMMGGTRERRGRCQQKALGMCDRLVGGKFRRGDEADDLVMLARRLEILPDGDEIDICRAQVVHQLQDLIPLFTKADHDAGFGKNAGIQFLDPLEQAD